MLLKKGIFSPSLQHTGCNGSVGNNHRIPASFPWKRRGLLAHAAG